jgi:phospholipase/lecithinase/hemolysin
VDICNSWCAALDLNKRDPSSYLADKIHPSKEGQQLMAETVFKHFVVTSAPETRWGGFIKTYKVKAGAAVR